MALLSNGGDMGKMVSFKRPDGKSVEGYLAEPASSASQSTS